MKHTVLAFFCSVTLTFTSMTDLQAQARSGSGEAHQAAAKAVAYKPGQDFTWVFDQNCKPPAPRPAQARPAQPAAQATPKIPPKYEWFQEPAQVFDNLYDEESQLLSMWRSTSY